MAVRSPSPLKVDPDTDALITQGAHFLGMTKKALVAAAVRDYLTARRADIEREVLNASAVLDGTHRSKVSLLSGLSADEINELGGLSCGWFIDSMPHREDQPGEVVWSNVMDREVVASLLNK